MGDLSNETIELFMIFFLGVCATYYSAKFVKALNLTSSCIEYWFPLVAGVITMYFAFRIMIRVFKKFNMIRINNRKV